MSDYFDWLAKKRAIKPKVREMVRGTPAPMPPVQSKDAGVTVEESNITDTAIRRIFKPFFKDREK